MALPETGKWNVQCRRVIVYPMLFAVSHDDVIKWKHFPCHWPFVRGISRSPVNSPHKGQWRGDLMFSLICALNKRLGKQWWGWWFEMQSRWLWRHCNVLWLTPLKSEYQLFLIHVMHLPIILRVTLLAFGQLYDSECTNSYQNTTKR